MSKSFLANPGSVFAACLLFGVGAFAADSAAPNGLLSLDPGATPVQTAASIQAMRARGVGTVSLDVWNHGLPLFPSSVMKAALGAARDPAAPTRDRLQEALIEAHRNGLNFIARLDDGFMAAQKDSMTPLRTQKPDWLSRAANGSELAPDGTIWLSLMHPQARRLMLDLAVEIADKYDVDGIGLDETRLWPDPAMGYDDSTRAAYATEHGGAAALSDAADPEWLRWRASKINEFGAQLRNAVNARHPSMRIISAPAGGADYPSGWRTPAIVLIRAPGPRNLRAGQNRWRTDGLARGRYRLIGHDGKNWEYLDDVRQDHSANMMTSTYFFEPFSYTGVELLIDRRADMRRPPAAAR